MILAELEVWHSRPVAPTRRVSLGRDDLPVDPAPGFGGLLLAGIVAVNSYALDADDLVELELLIDDVELGYRIPQPRLRHRLQVDKIGLQKSTHRLVGDGESLSFRFADTAPPAPQILAAVYRTGRFDPEERRAVFRLIRSAVKWNGPDQADLLAYLSGRGRSSAYASSMQMDPVAWAMETMGFDRGLPTRREVQRRFRELVRSVHPDVGGEQADAAARIGALSEARHILLSPSL